MIYPENELFLEIRPSRLSPCIYLWILCFLQLFVYPLPMWDTTSLIVYFKSLPLEIWSLKRSAFYPAEGQCNTMGHVLAWLWVAATEQDSDGHKQRGDWEKDMVIEGGEQEASGNRGYRSHRICSLEMARVHRCFKGPRSRKMHNLPYN